jgi:enediyne biosynthesis protein E3
VSATRLDVRGFHVKDQATRELLETVGASFLAGYGYAMEARTPLDAEAGLETVPARFRGFAYEGAAMGFAVLDGLPVGGGGRVARFLTGRAADHVYMVYVGVGWAMARMPRFRWSTLYAADPVLRWLILDGYGFHQAYFKTEQYVQRQYQPDRFPWPSGGPTWYAARVIDQGVGRAMWFVGGADAERVATMIDRFPAHRRADLYSGAGLAATYAGGATPDQLRAFYDRAGEHQPFVAQASAFAATARVRAGLLGEHTETATGIFCGMTAAEATQLSESNRPDSATRGELPAYEQWRQRLAELLAARKGATT